MSENRTDEGNASSQPAAATTPAELPSEVVSALVQPPVAAQPQAAIPPEAVSLPAFDTRLIHIIEKAGNPPEITAIQGTEIVQDQILEQKEK